MEFQAAQILQLLEPGQTGYLGSDFKCRQPEDIGRPQRLVMGFPERVAHRVAQGRRLKPQDRIGNEVSLAGGCVAVGLRLDEDLAAVVG